MKLIVLFLFIVNRIESNFKVRKIEIEKVKFIASEKDERFVSAIMKEVEREFPTKKLRKGNLRMKLKTVVMFSMFFFPFISLFIFPSTMWLGVGVILCMSLGQLGIGMSIMHDAAHGAYSEKEWVNKLLSHSIWLLGMNDINWDIGHNYWHHMKTNMPEDEDLQDGGWLRRSEHEELKKIHRYQHIYCWFLYSLFTFIRFFSEPFRIWRYQKNDWCKRFGIKPRKEYIKMFFIKTIYLFCMIGLSLLFTDFSFLEVLGGYIVLNLIVGFIFTVIFQLAHVVEGTTQPVPIYDEVKERWVIHTHWLVHELETSSDFKANFLFSWWIGGLNYQIVHHMFRDYCHVHYPKIKIITVEQAKKYGYFYNEKPSLWEALKSHVRTLKNFGRTQKSG